LLVFASGFIIVVPFFLLPNNVYLALKLTSIVAIIGLFSVGYHWAKFTDRNKIRTCAEMVLIGFLIATITTMFGG
jgi:VIT1/CCC1 family predicted Fe2+/Mn2+ transporter